MSQSHTFLQAAETVLRESGRPMTAAEVTRAALERGLLRTAGKTPEASMSAALYTAVNRDPQGPIRKVARQGRERAVRGSVRWGWRA